MSNSRVSIVVIARDESMEIRECLRSVLNAEPFEVIVVVDAETRDNTPHIARDYTDKVYVVNGKRGRLRNVGWQLAKGEWICYIDADMRIGAEFLAQFGQLDLRADEALVNIRLLPLGDSPWGQREWMYWDFFNAAGAGGSFYRRSTLEQVGGFDDSLHAGEDGELARRFRRLGWKKRRANTLYAWHRFPQHYYVLRHKLQHGHSGKFKAKAFIKLLISPLLGLTMALRYCTLSPIWYLPLRSFLILRGGKEGYAPWQSLKP